VSGAKVVTVGLVIIRPGGRGSASTQYFGGSV
jgi:hypothetical protein